MDLRKLQPVGIKSLLLALAVSLGLVGFCNPAMATALEEGFVDEPVLEGVRDPFFVQPERLEISEVTSVPLVASGHSELFRRQAGLVAGYIRNYNRKLAWDEVDQASQAIVQYSNRYGVDYRLVTSVIAVESAFRKDAISSSGAIGMGQLKPETAKWLGVLNPYDPVDNIAGTARFLAWLVRKYNGNLEYAISAYYQGPGNVDRNGITPACKPYLGKVNRALDGLI